MEEKNLKVQNSAKKLDFHKVFAVIGIILIVAIIIIGGVWYFVQSAEDKAGTAEDSITTKVATTSAKTATSSAKDETTDWETYTSTKFKYTIKFPKEWSKSVTSKVIDGNDSEVVSLNRQDAESAQNGKPNVTIYGNFNGDFCSYDPSVTTKSPCTSEDITLDRAKGIKLTYTTLDETIYNLIDSKKIVIITSAGNQKDLVDKVISTLKFL